MVGWNGDALVPGRAANVAGLHGALHCPLPLFTRKGQQGARGKLLQRTAPSAPFPFRERGKGLALNSRRSRG